MVFRDLHQVEVGNPFSLIAFQYNHYYYAELQEFVSLQMTSVRQIPYVFYVFKRRRMSLKTGIGPLTFVHAVLN